jgi:hypothetical protein
MAVMPRRKPERRTPTQAAADRAATELAKKLGKMLADGRRRSGLKQSDAAARAGISRGRWGDLEVRSDPGATLATLSRAAAAVGGSLEAYIRETSAADAPRDSVHLKNQNLVIGLSKAGGWTALPEEFIDREARTSRAADVLLERTSSVDRTREYSLWDIHDWIEDAGAAVRNFARRVDGLEQFAIARMASDEELPRTGGVFVLRATRRNRDLVQENRHFFKARFPGAAKSWLASLRDTAAPVPREAALVWVSVNGERLFA